MEQLMEKWSNWLKPIEVHANTTILAMLGMGCPLDGRMLRRRQALFDRAAVLHDAEQQSCMRKGHLQRDQ